MLNPWTGQKKPLWGIVQSGAEMYRFSREFYREICLTNEAQKILIIEDDDQIRDALRELFLCEGYSVRVAENGREGLEMMRTERPKLIFLDLMMPVLDGFGFLRAKQEAASDLAAIPVVLITAAGERNAQGCKVQEILTKPVEIDKLLAVAQRYLQ